MDPTPSLIALTPREWEDFFPGETADELRSLLPGAVELDPRELDAAAWARQLAALGPRLLVSGWKTPPLPEGLRVGPGGLEVAIHVPGSVRRLVPRPLIERGLVVSNWGDSISRTVAEGALLLVLAALRRAAYWSIAMHQEGRWKDDETRTGSLFGRRVGLHGFGSISRELVALLRPFGVPVATYSPRVPDADLAAHGVARAATLEALFSENDVVVELAALTPSNRGSVGEALLRRIPAGGVFVNVGRGAVVDESALARVAAEGRILVGLDVYDVEPLPASSPLRGLRNVVLLPHLGGPTTDRRRDAGAHALRSLRSVRAGGLPDPVISVEIYDRST